MSLELTQDQLATVSRLIGLELNRVRAAKRYWEELASAEQMEEVKQCMIEQVHKKQLEVEKHRELLWALGVEKGGKP
jgi:hypothetical protein